MEATLRDLDCQSQLGQLYWWFPSLFPVYPVRSPVAHSRSTARGVVGALQRALQHLPKVTGCPDFPRRRTENIRFGPTVWQAPQQADKIGLFRVFLLGTMDTYFTFSWCGLPFLLGLPRKYRYDLSTLSRRVWSLMLYGALPRWLRGFSPASQLCATPPLRRRRPRVCVAHRGKRKSAHPKFCSRV